MTKIYDTYKEIATNNYNAMKNIFTETTKLVKDIYSLLPLNIVASFKLILISSTSKYASLEIVW